MKRHEGLYRPKYRAPDGTVKESEVWWCRYSKGGRQVRESTHKTKVTEAQTVLDLRRGAVAKGAPIAPKADRILIDELLTDVLNDYRANGLRSLQSLEIRLNKHVLPFFEGKRAQSITAADVQRYVVKRQAEKAANASINRELSILSRAFTLGLRRNKILSRPYFEMLREDNVRKGFFEEKEFQTLLHLLPEDLQVAVEFAYWSGWRGPSEILTREWRHVDLERGIVRLEPGETKNRKGRIFPLTAELLELFRQQKERTREFERKTGRIIPLVFHHEGEPLIDSYRKPSKYFRKAWKEACKEAKLVGRTMHDFRRTAIRNFERNGIPREVGMKLSGHQTESVYRRYSIVTESDLFNAIEKLSLRASKVLAK